MTVGNLDHQHTSPMFINASQNVTPSPTTLVVLPENQENLGYLLDDTTDLILQLIFLVILSIICGLFGAITNIINIVVFIKQGLFSGGSVINLFFLAIADLGVTFTNFLHGIGFAVVVAKIPDLPIEPFSIIYLAIGWPHTIFIKINRMLTAFVAFERCMCVVIPFRVKNVFAPRRSLVYLLVIFAYGLFSHTPIYLIHGLGDVKQIGTNVTKIDLVFTADREFWHDLVYYGNFLALSFLTTILVIVCTIVTSTYVRTSKEWRNKASSAGTAVSASKDDENNMASKAGKGDNNDKKMTKGAVNKEARLVKMITTISAIFCICYIPEVALIILRSVDERINTKGQYERLSHIMYAVTFLSATINSSINIFVYYRMSSKYKQIFLSYFSKKEEKS